MAPNGITTAGKFIAFMEEVWGSASTPAPNGGTTVACHTGYDEFHNARKTAQAVGMVRSGGTKRNGQYWDVFRWPHGEGVAIQPSGDAVDRLYARWGRKTKTQVGL